MGLGGRYICHLRVSHVVTWPLAGQDHPEHAQSIRRSPPPSDNISARFLRTDVHYSICIRRYRRQSHPLILRGRRSIFNPLRVLATLFQAALEPGPLIRGAKEDRGVSSERSPTDPTPLPLSCLVLCAAPSGRPPRGCASGLMPGRTARDTLETARIGGGGDAPESAPGCGSARGVRALVPFTFKVLVLRIGRGRVGVDHQLWDVEEGVSGSGMGNLSGPARIGIETGTNP
jgi:hypothetical protein